MYYYRITKYNPNNRDCNGSYKNNEWTSIYDIGKQYKGKQFSYNDYIKYENSYVETVLGIMDFNNIKLLEICELEKSQSNNLYSDYDYMIETYMNGGFIKKDEIDKLIRLILREKVWAKLKYKSELLIHFGYDYYMYVITYNKLTKDIVKKINDKGLFVENKKSPF